MRLLIATDAFPPKSGGSGWSTFYLARALIARGHQVEIVQPKAGASGIHTRVFANLSVTEFGYPATNLPGARAWQRNRALDKNFVAFLRERARDADLIHAQHLLTIPSAVNAARGTNVPVVSTVRDYWHVCLYGTLWRDDGICPVCRGSELTRCLQQKYGAFANVAYPFVPLVEKELARRQRALRDSDAVIAVSNYVAEKLRGIVAAEKINVVPNLIDIQATRELAHRSPLALVIERRAQSYLLFIGKLNALKGADLLPEILRRAGVNLPLVVVGDGELASTLAREENFQLRGWLSNASSLQLLAGATALLFPSRWAEPLSRVLLEAQALGTPTIAFDTGGTRDIIEHEVNGLLARDVQDFSAQLTRLINDPALRARLSRAASRVAEEKFSSEIVGAQVEAVYQRALSCRANPAVSYETRLRSKSAIRGTSLEAVPSRDNPQSEI